MSTSQLEHPDIQALPKMGLAALPTTAERLPTPLERSHALVLADRDRRNLLGRWLTLLGVSSCRTALNSTPLTALTPMSGNELVVAESQPAELVAQVSSLRTRGWKNIVVSTQNIDPTSAAEALSRDVRVLIRRSNGPALIPDQSPTAESAQTSAEHHETQAEAQKLARDLTKRERVVLQLVARGKSNREIGEILELSPLTIKSHLSRISRKLKTGDRASMVLLALRGGAVR